MVIVSSDRRSTSCALSKHPDPALGLNKAGGEFVPPPRIRSVMARYVRCAHEVPTITRRCPRPVATTSGPVGRSSSFRWTGLRKLRRTAPQFRGPLWRWLDVPIPRSSAAARRRRTSSPYEQPFQTIDLSPASSRPRTPNCSAATRVRVSRARERPGGPRRQRRHVARSTSSSDPGGDPDLDPSSRGLGVRS